MKRGILFFLSVAFAGAGLAQEVIVIEADRMIDPRFDTPIENAVVVIRGEHIVQAGASGDVRRPVGAEVIDLSGYTILPGLIDCHVHISGRPGDGGGHSQAARKRGSRSYLRVAHAKITLEAGFTTIRNIGVGNYSDAALRDLIDDGVVPGPRMWVATRGLGGRVGMPTSTGGAPTSTSPGYAEIADGVDELRKAVRTQIKHGADVIKVTATGGVLSSGDALTDQQYSFEELRPSSIRRRCWERKSARTRTRPLV